MNQPTWSELSVEELLARAREEEKGALEELLRRSQSKLEKWAEQHVSSEAPGGNRPSDVVQVSALRAFKKFSTFKGTSEGELWAWLKRVLLSQAAQMAREALSQKRDDSGNISLDTEEAEGIPAPQRSPSQFTSQQEGTRQVLTAFARLPDDQREALRLFHLEELPVAEVARLMGRSEASVSSLMQRGLKTARALMAGNTSTPPEVSPEQAAVWNAVDMALLAYFRRRSAGESLDPNAFSAEYPSCAEELRGILHWLEMLRASKPSDED